MLAHNASHRPSRARRPYVRPFRWPALRTAAGVATLLTALVLLAGCATQAGPAREQRFTRAEAQRREQALLDVLLAPPAQRQRIDRETMLRVQRERLEAWQAVRRRVEAGRRRQAEQAGLRQAEFLRLMQQQQAQRQQRQEGAAQRWSAFMSRQRNIAVRSGGPARTAPPAQVTGATTPSQ